MGERPEQPPEGRLIGRAQKRARLSGRKAAELAGMSEGHWRAIVNGSRSLGSGIWVPVHAPAGTLARMAQVVGVTPEQLEEVDRPAAAEELRQLQAESEPEPDEEVPTTAELAERVAALQAQLDEVLRKWQEWQDTHGHD